MEDTVKVTVYGDFNCPYSYLASQRADQLARDGIAGIDWRAVEHDRGLALTGTASEAGRRTWDRELAEVAALALPGESVPSAPPPVISNTGAAVAAYAEAVTDGIADELRRRLFATIWAERGHISSAYEVRRVVVGLMWPQEDIAGRLASPDIASILGRDPDLWRAVRRSGGTIAPNGEPLTVSGRRRIRRWRQDWLALPSQVIPAVVGPGQILRSGTEALHYLAQITGTGNMPPRLPARAEDEPGTGSHRPAAARVA
jgi:2-hydroxychromene-2-carboxylate isomerase